MSGGGGRQAVERARLPSPRRLRSDPGSGRRRHLAGSDAFRLPLFPGRVLWLQDRISGGNRRPWATRKLRSTRAAGISRLPAGRTTNPMPHLRRADDGGHHQALILDLRRDRVRGARNPSRAEELLKPSNFDQVTTQWARYAWPGKGTNEMATVRKEILTNASPQDVWAAIRDIGALHTRLVPGFVIDTRLEPGARVVTFGNGMVVREPIITIDDAARRLVWSAVGGRTTHYNASAQVLAEDNGGRSKVVWLADFLPDDIAGDIDAAMEYGSAIMKKTLDRLGGPS
jgi:hypothetical protein